MGKFTLFTLGLVLATGCKKDPLDEVIDGMSSWKDKMCACKDKACADKVHEDYKKWENDVLEPKIKGIKKEDRDKSKMDKGDKLDKERKECRRKFNEPTGEGGGAAAPAAPTP